MRALLLSLLLIGLFGCKTREENRIDDRVLITNASKEIENSPPIIAQPPLLPMTPLEPRVIIYPPRGGGGGKSRKQPEIVHFVPNSYSFWVDPAHATTHLLKGCTGSNCACTAGEENCQAIPAFANVVLEPENFIWCKGGPYALCYYSGPNDGSTNLSCQLSQDGRFANCNCFEVSWGAYFVDINSILNYPVYQQTLAICGADGANCSGPSNVNKAPVCQAINSNTLIPGADMVSTFSFDCVPTNGIGQTNCGANLYAGCMTAPCKKTATEGIVECSCPTYNGPYQVGSAIESEQCVLPDNLVWSAAFSPTGTTIPPQNPCIPDAPGGSGCPLLPAMFPPASPEDCIGICDAYACQNSAGIQPGYTCDATLCTGQCNDRDLVQVGCEDLGNCPAAGILAIAQLEAKKGCSCCASQLCGCTPNEATCQAMYALNQRQIELSITPQCSENGTLCGSQTGACQ